MRTRRIVTSLVVLVGLLTAIAHAEEQPWISLFDGKTLSKALRTEGPVKIVDGRLELTKPGRLNYEAEHEGRPGDFQNFDFATDVLTEPGAKCGISFIGKREGISRLSAAWVEIDNSREVNFRPYPNGYGKTGSLMYDVSQFKSIAKDGEWFKLRIRLQNHRLCIWVNDTLVTDRRGPRGGGFAILTESPDAKISFKNMRFQNLKHEDSKQDGSFQRDAIDQQMEKLRCYGFPLINYHIHLKGDLTLEKALAHSRETGVFYGIAANCGVNFPITNDRGINDYVKKLEGQPCFIGMQAEGREWPTLFSKEAIARFDYIFTDAMTIVDHRGKRARLWMPAEVDIPDKQAFMELLVRTIERILDNEPVDIYANPTYLPDVLIKEYDTLWTPERLKRVIDAAARNGVAIEISNRLKLPKADFIRQAKKAGIKFTVGTNNVDSKLGREEYALQMIRECDLQPSDMFLPKPDGKKPIQVRGFKSSAKK